MSVVIEEDEISIEVRASDPTVVLDALPDETTNEDQTIPVAKSEAVSPSCDEINICSDAVNNDAERDYSSDSGDEAETGTDIPISQLIAKQKRVVVEEDISNHLITKSHCEINFGEMVANENFDPKLTKAESLEICDPNSETVQSDAILEAKIITRQDTVQEDVDFIGMSGTANRNESETGTDNKDTSKDAIIAEDTSLTESKPDKGIKIVDSGPSEAPATNNQTTPPSPKKKSNPRAPRKDKLLSNYDIIDRTEAKKIEEETNSFSFGNLVGRFKRAFGHIEHPPYRRQSDSSQSSSSYQNTIVNLSIEETKSGEQMQVITISPLAKSSTVGEGDNHQEDRMIVYVDELDGDYFDVGLDDNEATDVSDDESDCSERLDQTDIFISKGRSTYDLTEDNNKQIAVAGVSIKNSSTFTASDRGISKLATQHRRTTISDVGGFKGLLQPFDIGTLKKSLPNEAFVLATDGYPTNIPSFPSDRRSLIALEMYTTERTFVRGLEIIVLLFKRRISMSYLMDAKELEMVFSNIDQILDVNRDILEELFERISDWSDEQCIGDIFVKHEKDFKIYSVYCKNYDTSEALIKQKMKKKKDLETLLASCYSNPICAPGLTLPSYLITVIQRIPRYILLFKDLIKRTSDTHPDYQNLARSQLMMEVTAKYINEQLKQAQCAKALEALQTQITGLKAYYTPDRTLVHEGDVCLLTSKKTYHCVLFNDLLVFSVKSGVRQIAVELALQIKNVWVEDLNELDPQTTKKDAIAIYTPERPYTMYVGSQGEKKIWLQNLRQTIEKDLNGNQAPADGGIDTDTRNTNFTYKDETVYSGDFCKAKRHGQGTGMWPNQFTYTGEWEDDERNGYGVLNYACGDNYNGEWIDNKQDGKGTYINKRGDKVTGVWRDGLKCGDVTIEYHNGDCFEGFCTDDRIAGEGELICKNGFVYKGQLKDNLKHGKGHLNTPDGYEYSGQFRHDKFHGEGELHYPDAAIYKGEFDRGQRCGQGTYTQPGGCSYEGQWMHDLKDGRGKMEYANGDVYEGTWVQDMRLGQGVMVFAYGGYYRGQWLNDLMHGSGILELKDGSVYDGEFSYNKMCGSGKMKYRHGALYNGQWRDGCQCGKGILTKPGQWSCDGSWEQGKQHGYCVLRDPINDYSYEGNWEIGVREGQGKESLNNSTFEGQFVDDLRQGSGLEKFEDGTIYKGTWVRGQKHGAFTHRKQHTIEHQSWSNGCLVRTPSILPPREIPNLQRWL